LAGAVPVERPGPAAQLFNNRHFPLIGDVIWLTYGPAQMLIVYTAGSALLALARS
jgi:hypothetical protein